MDEITSYDDMSSWLAAHQTLWPLDEFRSLSRFHTCIDTADVKIGSKTCTKEPFLPGPDILKIGGVCPSCVPRVMGKLFYKIQRLVADAKYVVGLHASERLEERGIMEWQAVVGLEEGQLIVERPYATPNPAVEVRELLPDGREFKAVWSYLRQSDVAKLVTVHFFDRD